MSIFHRLRRARVSSTHALYSGGNCAEFQLLKCAGYGYGEVGKGGKVGVRAGMHVSLITLKLACAVQWRCIPTPFVEAHTAMNAGRIAVARREGKG